MTRLFCLLSLLLGVFIGANSTGFLTSHKEKPPVAAVSPVALKSATAELQAQYQNSIDSLTAENTVLGSQVMNTATALQQAKKDNKALRKVVDTLISHAATTTDTAARLTDCDSMQAAMQGLLMAYDNTDSVYESLTIDLQAQVANKDSTLHTQQQAYNALKASLDNSFAQQDLLTAQNHWFEQRMNRQRTGNKLLTAGMCIVSGIALYSFIRH